METIKLPKKFDGKGSTKNFEFEQVFENDFGYVYKVDTKDGIHYEAFLKKTYAHVIDFEKKIFSDTHVKESYPTNKAFGVWAWTFKSLDRAIDKLISKKPQKQTP